MLRDVYARQALLQLPRLLTLQDRSPLSKTYGCFHRDFWLYKTSDFPDAVRQFGVHALALVYAKEFPENRYFGNPEIREWAIAGLTFWAAIQHREGSYDEFYPYERGWVGPTAFTTYAACEAYILLSAQIEDGDRAKIEGAIARAASFIAKGESEEDLLANHYAMAALAVWKAHRLLGEPRLLSGYERIWEGFCRLHNRREGWSIEYDGADPGYQSATVSFLGKIWADSGEADLLETLRQSVEFCSYFAFPDGHYGGTIGSRNTLHFYPHGFELLSREIPLAASVADRMLRALAEDKLVPPHIMSDRYVFYRVPELLLAYLDHGGRPDSAEVLPDAQDGLDRWLPDAGIKISTRRRIYAVSNLAKGGVVKLFDRSAGRMILSDGGVLAQLSDGRLVTSQWVDGDRRCEVNGLDWIADGPLHVVPSDKTFTPLRGLAFRLVLICLGWLPWAAHRLKGAIRKTLMLGSRPVAIRLRRSFEFNDDGVTIVDHISKNDQKLTVRAMRAGGDFSVRYVPQSRFFQPHELQNHEFEVRVAESDFRRLLITKVVRFDQDGEPVVSMSLEYLES